MLRSIQHKDMTWIDIQSPKPEDITYLETHFNFHEFVLEELIPPGHRPRITHGEDYLFVILYYPTWSKAEKSVFPRELDIIVTKDHIITSHYHTIPPVKALFEQVNLDEGTKEEKMSQTPGHLFFEIIDGVLRNALVKLEHIEKKVNRIEERIFKGEEREVVVDISVAKRDVIDFRRILAPQANIIESLVFESTNFFGKELEPHFEDLRGTFSIVWNEIENHRETLQALEKTNESLLTTKTNESMRLLTAFSVILLPPTLVVNIWGMNLTSLPFSEYRNGFLVIAGLLVLVILGLVIYFRKRKWL